MLDSDGIFLSKDDKISELCSKLTEFVRSPIAVDNVEKIEKIIEHYNNLNSTFFSLKNFRVVSRYFV